MELESGRAEYKEAEKIAAEAKELVDNVIDAVRDPLVVMDADLKILSVSKTFYTTFKVKPDETLGKFIYELGDQQWDIPKLRELLEEILPKNASLDNYVVQHNFPGIGIRIMILNARRIPRPPEKPRIILLAITDITDVDKFRSSFLTMLDSGVLKEIGSDQKTIVSELKQEVDGLLRKFGGKLKYSNGAK